MRNENGTLPVPLLRVRPDFEATVNLGQYRSGGFTIRSSLSKAVYPLPFLHPGRDIHCSAEM
jgi:hypothetical protein